MKVNKDYTKEELELDILNHFGEGFDECIERNNIGWEEGVEVEPIDYTDLIMGNGIEEMTDPQEYKDNRDIPTYDFSIIDRYEGDFFIGEFLVMDEDLEEQE